MTDALALLRGKWFNRHCMAFSLLCAVLVHPAAHAFDYGTSKSKLNKRGLVIQVSDNGWGDASAEDIERVLYSVAAELAPYFPRRTLPVIRVQHGDDAPAALYEKVSNGQYVILLTAKDRYWGQFAYQFAHELCHVMSNFDNSDARLAHVKDPNQWFEESLCEAASLFALKQIAATWEIAPPYPHWKNYAPAMRRYADKMLEESHRKLPQDLTLAIWFAQNENAVRDNPYLRAKNEVVASRLLNLLEQHPEQWGALAYLNDDKRAAPKNISEYLRHWYECCPDGHKPFVQQIMTELGVTEGNAVHLANLHPASFCALKAVSLS